MTSIDNFINKTESKVPSIYWINTNGNSDVVHSPTDLQASPSTKNLSGLKDEFVKKNKLKT